MTARHVSLPPSRSLSTRVVLGIALGAIALQPDERSQVTASLEHQVTTARARYPRGPSRSSDYFRTTHRNHQRAPRSVSRAARARHGRGGTRRGELEGEEGQIELVPPVSAIDPDTDIGRDPLAADSRQFCLADESRLTLQHSRVHSRGLCTDDHFRPSSGSRTNVSDTLSAVCHLE